MKATVYPGTLKGTIDAIASKSMAHRLLICAAMSEGYTRVRCNESSEDIDATIDCLRAMGSKINKIGNYYIVPKITAHPGQFVTLDCRESGTTLRLMICIAAGIGLSVNFKGSDRLFSRPLKPLTDVLTEHGIVFTRDNDNRIIQSGRAFLRDYRIRGDVSSQFISGLLLMLPLCGGGTVTVEGDFESKPYVELTACALREADVQVDSSDRTYIVSGRYDLQNTEVEGDWSNGCFWLGAGALGADLQVRGLDINSPQGDRKIISVLENFGAKINAQKDTISCEGGALYGIDVDARDIPDAVPVLSVIAAASQGTTKIRGIQRLRLKESDRVKTVTDMINALGGSARDEGDTMVIEGTGSLRGGTVNASRDHRIAMSAAISSLICTEPVTILDAGSVSKSYPDFFSDLISLGAKVRLED